VSLYGSTGFITKILLRKRNFWLVRNNNMSRFYVLFIALEREVTAFESLIDQKEHMNIPLERDGKLEPVTNFLQ
jgi:hypothetical protein